MTDDKGRGRYLREDEWYPRRGEGILRKGLDILMPHPPEWQEPKPDRLSTINMYYWYYASHALFQYEGRPWKEWKKTLESVLVNSQRSNGDEKGSWNPIGEWGIAGGRVYSTALGALTLQVYYRIPRTR